MSATMNSRSGRGGANLRHRKTLNKLLEKHSNTDVSERTMQTDPMDISTASYFITDESTNKQTSVTLERNINVEYANSVLKRLFMNDERYDRLELDSEMLNGCGYAALLRSLCENTNIKHVKINAEFLEGLQENEEKIRMLLEIIGRLPQLENLTIDFPNRMHGSAASMLCSAVKYGGETIKTIEVRGLRLVASGEEDELADAFECLHQLKSLRLLDLVSYNVVDVDPFLETVAELPALVELEIRMKYKKPLRGMYFEALCCHSESLESLILWNMELDMVQVTHLCEALEKSTCIIKSLELWRCDLGRTFGVLLTDVLPQNKSLEKIIISHVGFHGSSVMALLTNALKKNSYIRELRLLNVCGDNQDRDADRVTKSAINMIMHNDSIDSFTLSYDELSEQHCIELDKQFRRNAILRKRQQEQADAAKKGSNNNGIGGKQKWKIIFGLFLPGPDCFLKRLFNFGSSGHHSAEIKPFL